MDVFELEIGAALNRTGRALIASASGQPFEAFVRERIFEPLGTRGTGFSVRTQKPGRFTTE